MAKTKDYITECKKKTTLINHSLLGDYCEGGSSLLDCVRMIGDRNLIKEIAFYADDDNYLFNGENFTHYVSANHKLLNNIHTAKPADIIHFILTRCVRYQGDRMVPYVQLKEFFKTSRDEQKLTSIFTSIRTACLRHIDKRVTFLSSLDNILWTLGNNITEASTDFVKYCYRKLLIEFYDHQNPYGRHTLYSKVFPLLVKSERDDILKRADLKALEYFTTPSMVLENRVELLNLLRRSQFDLFNGDRDPHYQHVMTFLDIVRNADPTILNEIFQFNVSVGRYEFGSWISRKEDLVILAKKYHKVLNLPWIVGRLDPDTYCSCINYYAEDILDSVNPNAIGADQYYRVVTIACQNAPRNVNFLKIAVDYDPVFLVELFRGVVKNDPKALKPKTVQNFMPILRKYHNFDTTVKEIISKIVANDATDTLEWLKGEDDLDFVLFLGRRLLDSVGMSEDFDFFFEGILDQLMLYKIEDDDTVEDVVDLICYGIPFDMEKNMKIFRKCKHRDDDAAARAITKKVLAYIVREYGGVQTLVKHYGMAGYLLADAISGESGKRRRLC